MSSSTAKRLILYRFNRLPMEALVHADAYLTEGGVPIMTRDGNLHTVDYEEIKAICFGAEGGPADLFTGSPVFERRPKTPGLWTCFRLRDGDLLEGVLPHNLLEWPKQGFLLTPPRSNIYRQRVFIPRQSVRETVLRGMVGKVSLSLPKIGRKADSAEAERQLSMFE